MKHMLVVAALLVAHTVAYADALVLKSGKRIEWRLLRDKGDAYEVEAQDGTAMIIQKRDIERIDLVEVKPALAGAAISFEGKTKTVDLLPAINPKRDTVFGVVKYTGNALVVASEIDAPTIVKVPVKLPEEYDLALTVDRRSTIGNFYLGLTGASGAAFLVEFDGQNGSMSTIVGGTSQRGPVLEKGMPHAVLIQVRREAVMITVDKKECLFYRGSVAGLSMPESHKPKGDPCLFIGTQRIYGNSEHANFQLLRMSMTTKP